jgi:hypothetical protein
MTKPKVLEAFSSAELGRVHFLLAAKVAVMMGRKLEEGDWSEVYCQAKGIACKGWSNLNIDVMHGTLGVEHKMLCVRSAGDIREVCGTRQMHPSATRSIRIPENEQDATNAARVVLAQYGELIEQRTARVEQNGGGSPPDMRTGWLLWQESLRQFMYFEEQMLAPNPEDYIAEWKFSGSENGIRKRSRNLWVYERDTGIKRYSITTAAGAKIQPYFDVPPPTEPNLYVFTVQGELLPDGKIRIWVTEATAKLLEQVLGTLDPVKISAAILKAAAEIPKGQSATTVTSDSAVELIVTVDAYEALKVAFSGVSDEHMMQLIVKFLQGH